MGKKVIQEEIFPEIVQQYNTGGKTAAYDYLRSKYGIRNPYFVITRIKGCGRYTYNPDTDCFSEADSEISDSVFMSLDELCKTSVAEINQAEELIRDSKPAAMEQLIHELIGDRLLILSKYISLDSSTRTIMIDRTSLSADGYRILTH